MTTLLYRGLLAALLVLAVAAPGAAAAPQQLSMMMDDDLLVYRSDRTRDQAMQRMKGLGVDYVRVTMLWSVVAERARDTRARRRRFRPDRPSTYPVRNWDRYDNLVRTAQRLGLGVYFNVTGPAPHWARGRAPRGARPGIRRAWRPSARQYELFLRAVGRRYSGRYRDENAGRARIPRVAFWSLWNEPNQGAWLAPQWQRGRYVAPSLYRTLFLRGRRALDATGHGRDVILLGETAPTGVRRRTISSATYPTHFLRTLLCAGGNRRGCGDFRRYGALRATGFAHHPYTEDRSPLRRDPHPDSLTLANLGSLAKLLDDLARRTGRLPGGLPIFVTEYGFETNPPDRYKGVSLANQADWNQLGDFITYSSPRVRSITQFLLRDVAPVRGARGRARFFTYQSGLFYNSMRAKPAVQAYRFPFIARPVGGSRYAVWGQLRFRPNFLPSAVQVEFRPEGGGAWRAVGDPIGVDNAFGFFEGSVQAPGPGELRGVWADAVSSRPWRIG
jgi:hypothetical protein